MDLFVCDNQLNVLTILDNYSEVVWTERYNSCGDFQLEMAFNEGLYHLLTDGRGMENDYYLRIRNSGTIMVFEECELTVDEDGPRLSFKGRSLESLLDRRIIYGQTEVLEDLETNIRSLIEKNIINPEDQNRSIPNFTMIDSGDERIAALEFNAQYFCDNLYDVIEDICKSYSVGFRLTQTQAGYVFQLFMGEDRSLGQEDNPCVIFSPRFDNLVNSSYVESATESKNVAIIAGEGARSAVTYTEQTRDDDVISGLARRELYVDASNLSKTVEENGRQRHLTDEEYQDELKSKGLDELSGCEYVRSFDGEIESDMTFKYGVDYFIGDIVELENEYGTSSKSKVIELIRSYNQDGYKEYPTFEKVE